MDKIRLNNIQIYAYHGLFEEEKKIGQKFQVEVELSIDLSIPCKTDNIHDTVNYKNIYDIVEQTFINSKKNLIETVASEIARIILKDSRIIDTKIIIRKPAVPIEGVCDSIEIEIYRKNNDK